MIPHAFPCVLFVHRGPGSASQRCPPRSICCCPHLSGGIPPMPALGCSGRFCSCPPSCPPGVRGTAGSLTAQHECALPCNAIGHVRCARYKLGPVQSGALCFRSRRLIRRDTTQRESSVVREPCPASFHVEYSLLCRVVGLEDAQSSPEPPQLPARSPPVLVQAV